MSWLCEWFEAVEKLKEPFKITVLCISILMVDETSRRNTVYSKHWEADFMQHH